MDPGTVGRARSAVPLSHGPQDPALLDDMLARYRARSFTPAFRLPDTPAFDALHPGLLERGFVREQPTWTQVGQVGALLALGPVLKPQPGLQSTLSDTPSPAWMAMFLGAGLDPVDGASRAASLGRAQGTCFVSVSQHGEVLASGAVSFSHGWMGVHGMRTAAARRGEGLAAQVLLSMAHEAHRRGIDREFLQVLADNSPALALYRRCGLRCAWPYAYWRLKT